METRLSRDSPCQREIVAYNFPSARDYWRALVAVNRSRDEVRVSGRLPSVTPGIAINGNTAARRTPVPLARS